jgi:hypothetical protein
VTLGLFDVAFVGNLQPPEPWTPAQLSPAVWLDASDSTTVQLVGSAVAQWGDKSGNSQHFGQADSTLRPTYETAAQNGLNAIRIINGPGNTTQTKQYLNSSITYSGSQISLFSVHLNDAGFGLNTFSRLFSFAASAGADFNSTVGIALTYGVTSGIALFRDNRTIATTGAIDNQWCFVSAERNGTAGRISLNGGTFVTGTTSANNQGIERARIGNDFAAADSGMYGWAAEKVIVFGALSDANWQRLQGYAAHKWGLTANLPNDHPYKSAAPTL